MENSSIPCPLRIGRAGHTSCDRPQSRAQFLQDHKDCTNGERCLVFGSRESTPELVDETNATHFASLR